MAASGCARTQDADVTLRPAPSVPTEQRIPLVIGVYYPPEFLAYTRERVCAPIFSLDGRARFDVFSVGAQSAITFSRVFGAYFQRVLRFEERPDPTRPANKVDAVLIPEVRPTSDVDAALVSEFVPPVSLYPQRLFYTQRSNDNDPFWERRPTHVAIIAYRLTIVDPSGQHIARLFVWGYRQEKGHHVAA
jgi:hypothetical protein